VTSTDDLYTYVDLITIINLSGAEYVKSDWTYNYNITMEANYTGTITLDDGGAGGTWPDGNTLTFNNETSKTISYIPTTPGDRTLTATAPESYIEDGVINLTVIATAFSVSCYSNGGSTANTWTSSAFTDPDETLDCRLVFNGAFNGTVSLNDVIGGGGNLGGVFDSDDLLRFSGDTVTTTYADTATLSSQTVNFTYTPPTATVLDGLYDGSNGYYIYWPTITPVATPTDGANYDIVPNSTVSVGILAQEYYISKLSSVVPCVNCQSNYRISTHNAPYFGNIVLSDDITESDTPGGSNGTFDTDGLGNDTAVFDGSGIDYGFRYTPKVAGKITINGASNNPAIPDSDLVIKVEASDITIVGTTALKRGETGSYTLTTEPGWVGTVSLNDIYSLVNTTGTGVFTDTTGDGTYDSTDKVYTFDGTTNTRTFDYTMPLNAGNEAQDGSTYTVRLQGTTSDNPAQYGWALVSIIPNGLTIHCANVNPTCNIGHVGELQDYMLHPNGVFSGAVEFTDNAGGVFSDEESPSLGVANWSNSFLPFDFEYTPTTPGLQVLTATPRPGATNYDEILANGPYTFDVYVMADNYAVTGPAFIDAGTSNTFTLTLNGPYIGSFDLSANVPDSISTAIPGTIFSNGGVCNFTLDDYDELTNTTSCQFQMTLPLNGTNGAPVYWTSVRAAPVGNIWPLISGAQLTGVLATGLTMECVTGCNSPAINSPITYRVTPNGLYDGQIDLSDGGAGGVFSVPSLTFSSADWPTYEDVDTFNSAEFTYTPKRPGMIKIMATDANGSAGSTVVEIIVPFDPIAPPFDESETGGGPGVIIPGVPNTGFMRLNIIGAIISLIIAIITVALHVARGKTNSVGR
jgi:hypothetical protein